MNTPSTAAGVVADRPSRQRDVRVRVLVIVAAVSALTLVMAVVGLAADPRVITGAPAWLKPAKFAVSIAIYCATLAWLLTLVHGHRRTVAVLAWVTGVALAMELVLIGMQVVRGTTSHFNTDNPFDSAVFSAMGGLVALVFLAAVVTGGLLLRQRGLPRVLGSGIRGGVAVAVLGMATAVLMLTNTQYTQGGGHTVGAPDGGPGMLLTGWSTLHGDLRIAHFVGLHALQVLPLIAWLVHRFASRLTEDAQVGLVRLATAATAGLVVLLVVQAERGLPLFGPDSLVVGAALGGLVVVTGVAARLVTHGVRS